MFVVCDTCSLIMLLRIAPSMFTDGRYKCITIQSVLDEFVRAKRFKTRYPWRDTYRPYIKPILLGNMRTPDFLYQQPLIKALAATAKNPRQHNRPYALSSPDLDVLTTAIANDWKLTTVEHNLTDFAEQEFNLSVLSPLYLVNEWITAKLLEWDDAKQGVLDDWIAQNERPQPSTEIMRFEKLTHRKYPTK